MDVERLGLIAQVATYGIAVLAVCLQWVALVRMSLKRARRNRMVLMATIDAVALALILGPALAGWLHASSHGEWVTVFQIAGFALELFKGVLVLGEFRNASFTISSGTLVMLVFGFSTAGLMVAFGLFTVKHALNASPYYPLYFYDGDLPKSTDCSKQDCPPLRHNWSMREGANIDSRASADRDLWTTRDYQEYRISVSAAPTCLVTARWAVYVDGVSVASAVTSTDAGHHVVKADPFRVPVGQFRVPTGPASATSRSINVFATRTDTSHCHANFLLEES